MEFIKTFHSDDLRADLLKDKYHYIIEFFVRTSDGTFKHFHTELTEDYFYALKIVEQYINGEYTFG